MEFTVSAEDVAFRKSVRSWLEATVPSFKDRPPITREGREQSEFMRRWQRKLFDDGWAGISWPKEYGGRGLTHLEQVIWYEEYARADAPELSCFFVALQHGGPTLIVHGTHEQKSFYLPRILRGEDIWCQGFSEPGAGSDLASLSTRGEVDGDHLVVNGSKIWTSFAQIANRQELLVRTEAGSQRHKGITWIICDMDLPGITVRPIKSMDGEHHNCEVFYDNVRIPLKNVVGELGQGWKVAMATLSFERGTAFLEKQLRLSQTIEKLIKRARSTPGPDGRPLIEDGAIAAKLGRLRARGAALKAMSYMGASRGLKTEVPGPEGTFVALQFAELQKETYQFAMEMLGPEGMERTDELNTHDLVHQYLYSYQSSIGGGTTEIRRNIIAERLLGLPRHA